MLLFTLSQIVYAKFEIMGRQEIGLWPGRGRFPEDWKAFTDVVVIVVDVGGHLVVRMSDSFVLASPVGWLSKVLPNLKVGRRHWMKFLRIKTCFYDFAKLQGLLSRKASAL